MKALTSSGRTTLIAFLAPAWAGNHIVEVEIIITQEDLKDYGLRIHSTYKEAHKQAHLTIMSKEDYEQQF